jgi:hypothetical protein
VFRQVQPNASARNGNEQGKARLELMLPLLAEAQALVPPNGTGSVLDIENGNDLFFHATQTYRAER